MGGTQLGIITSGTCYQYVKEVFGDSVSVLKLGMLNPLPVDLIRNFAEQVDRLVVVEELDGFIDRAVLSGMEQISIIHGKGTGALRAGIHSYLKRHKNVAGFRLGTFGEGEAGVTIATLK